MKNSINSLSRRRFLHKGALALSGVVYASHNLQGAPAIIKNLGKPNSKFNGVQIGAISYSFRSLPCSAEELLKYCVDSNVSAIELMGSTAEAFAGAPHTSTAPMQPGPRAQRTAVQQAEQDEKNREIAEWRTKASMDKFVQLRKMYNDAGVSIYAWKPSALGEKNTDAEIVYALKAAKELGATHVTVEIPTDPAQSKRLGQFADQHKIGIGYHGHLQQTISAWDAALAQANVAAGFDPIPLLEAKHDRIYSMHIKDRKSKANGGDNMPWGQGDTPIVPVLQLLKKNKYKFPATVELEYTVPDGSDAVKEVAKCVEYCRKGLENGAKS